MRLPSLQLSLSLGTLYQRSKDLHHHFTDYIKVCHDLSKFLEQLYDSCEIPLFPRLHPTQPYNGDQRTMAIRFLELSGGKLKYINEPLEKR